jgi:hypothetical protein
MTQLIRLSTTVFLLAMTYRETGFWTVLCLSLIALQCEMQTLAINEKTTKYLPKEL